MRTSILGIVLFVALGLQNFTFGDDPIEFGRDIRPILSDTCFKCHGPDSEERAADLRLDTKAGIFDDGAVVEPGDLESSELYQRIITDDGDSLMPPHDSGRTLTDEQKDLIRRWIEQGANYQKHWSLEPPTRPELPKHDHPDWPTNAIDHFILAKLSPKGLEPSQESERATLIRRVALDLTGLPPTDELFKQALKSTDPNWYETLVDALLASEHYGEHMARYWLDVARYADTHGLHLDNYREMWPYRDWIIQAFNRGMPFDQFGTEQLAGDLLPSPTDSQLIATGFNRSHVTTNEGGSIKEEIYVRNVVDRVSTTGTVFMGLTVGCAQCHDHKFDPISQKDFYQLFAFFNSLESNPMDGNVKDHAPVLRKMSDAEKDREAKFTADIKSLGDKIKTKIANYNFVEPIRDDTLEKPAGPQEFVWIDDEIPQGAKKEQKWQFVSAVDGPVNSGDNSREQLAQAKQMRQHFFTKAAIPLRVNADDTLFAYVFLDPKNPPQEIMLQYNDGSWEHRAYWGANLVNFGSTNTPGRHHMGPLPETGKWIRLEIPSKDIGFNKPTMVNGMAFTQAGGLAYWDSAGIVSEQPQNAGLDSLVDWTQLNIEAKGEGLPNPIKKIFKQPVDKWNAKQKDLVRRHFLENVHPTSKKLVADDQSSLAKAEAEKQKFVKSIPTTLIWKEASKPKDAFMLNRGEYDQKGDKVSRAVPEQISAWSPDAPLNRLGLAQWLFSKQHPLTARVTVNRFWLQLFGTGIVDTAEDFGAQGGIPSHPALLDWLATDFVDNGWDVRRLIKQMVMSSTYRQSSRATPEMIRIDPANRLLGRGARYRLDAESLRDQALAISEMLVSTIGGPSVKPPQPDGLWFTVGYSDSNTVRFKKDNGDDKVHRRSLYTFWKRTSPPPQMATFDAPSREACSVRRERTNTPLQALLLMNDPQYIEAARHLAQLTVDTTFSDDEQRIQFMYSRALRQSPSPSVSKLITETLGANRSEFSQNKKAAQALIAIGEKPADPKYDAVELASWTMIANLIMNMDEFVSKN